MDLRTAIIDVFRGEAEILKGTEAAAEGIKLQFCALVVTHDLPSKPQRIGRCQRFRE